MRNIVGRPVSGNGERFGRDEENEVLWEDLQDHSILLLGPRRVGKTTVLLRLQEEAPGRAWVPIHVNVEGCVSEAAFLAALYAVAAAQSEKVAASMRKGWFAKALATVKEIKLPYLEATLAGPGAPDWRQLGDELCDALEGCPSSWLFLVDELPVFLLELERQERGIDRVRQLLHWLRSLRQPPHPLAARSRWVLAGSIGLDTVAGNLDLTRTVNDLLKREIGPFSEGVATAFLHALATGRRVQFAPDAVTHALARIGWLIPYHLQLLVQSLHEGDAQSPITSAQVDAALERLTSPNSRIYFNTWNERLEQELGSNRARLARRLLLACARDVAGATQETLLGLLAEDLKELEERDRVYMWLSDVLHVDGYLVLHEGRHRFRSLLLRAWWLRRFAP